MSHNDLFFAVQAPKRVAESALAAQEAAEAVEAGKQGGGGGAAGSGDRSPAPRSALSQALSTLGSAPPRGSLTVSMSCIVPCRHNSPAELDYIPLQVVLQAALAPWAVLGLTDN